MAELIVAGAGPTGLILALNAAQAGHRVTILEAADSVGGMAGSFEVAGQRVDYGSHRLHGLADPQLLAQLQDLLGTDLQARERNGRILLRRRWVGFPLRPLDMVRSLPLGFSSRVAKDTLMGPFRWAAGDSFDDAVRSQLGPTVASEFYAPYARKLYGVESTELTNELAARRVSARSPLAIVAKALRATRSSGRTFYYPRLGYGQISERLAEAAVEAGVAIELSCRVRRVTSSGGVEVEAGNQRFHGDTLFSTIPTAALADAVSPAPPSVVANSLGRLRTRAMCLVYLALDRPQFTDFDAHYFPDDHMAVARLSEPKNYRSGPDPQGHTVLCAELPCWVGDEVWNGSDEALGERVAQELRDAGLPDPGSYDVVSRRLPSVYPVYERSTEADRVVVDGWRDAAGPIVSLGRQGLGVPDNLHHVLAMGQRAAAVLDPGGSFDPVGWAEARRDFRDHVVED
ncbi:MAG: FAD-dependent oxidoreductase [Acidimicrobiales bacterium]|jgi:protoporphyrinogen oxidase|nr:FAD-dependent oxidoreductase [Acidimicrobiales bacterium]